jgi:hypothetical protein
MSFFFFSLSLFAGVDESGDGGLQIDFVEGLTFFSKEFGQVRFWMGFVRFEEKVKASRGRDSCRVGKMWEQLGFHVYRQAVVV